MNLDLFTQPAATPRRLDRPRITSSPWGAVQTEYEHAPGVSFVSTAGHGGIKLDRARNAKVPAPFREPGGWYEEDCGWCIPAIIHPDAFTAENQEAAESTARHWFPDFWEHVHGRKLTAAESRAVSEREWKATNAHRWQVVSACGDWHATVPAGMVGCTAYVGGRPDRGDFTSEPRHFLVTKEDYDTRGPWSFACDDPSIYPAWDERAA